MIRATLILFLLLPCSVAHATPDSGSWHTETLIGETMDYFFVLRTEGHNPGSYYEHTDNIVVQQINKVGLSIDHEWVLSSSSFAMDQNTFVWGATPHADSMATFPDAFTGHNIYSAAVQVYPFAFEVDSTGVDATMDGYRVQVIHRDALKHQIPEFGWNLRVVGVSATLCPQETPLAYVSIYSEGIAGPCVDLVVIHRGKLQGVSSAIHRQKKAAAKKQQKHN